MAAEVAQQWNAQLCIAKYLRREYAFAHWFGFAGEKLWEVQCESPTFTVAWHPKKPLLAYACDDKDGKYDSNREAGTVKLFGLPNDS